MAKSYSEFLYHNNHLKSCDIILELISFPNMRNIYTFFKTFQICHGYKSINLISTTLFYRKKSFLLLLSFRKNVSQKGIIKSDR